MAGLRGRRVDVYSLEFLVRSLIAGVLVCTGESAGEIYRTCVRGRVRGGAHTRM
jgi:hypothetical protein